MEKQQTRNWKKTIEECKSSGLSVKKFSGLHGINYHALNYHIRKGREENDPNKKKSSEFIQVPLNRQSLGNIRPEVTVQVEERSVTIKVRFES